MKNATKLLGKLGLGMTSIVVPASLLSLVSCNDQQVDPQPIQINMNNGDDYQFCNSNLMKTLVCVYPFQITGGYKNGDVLETIVSKQTINGCDTKYLTIDGSCQQIQLVENIHEFNIIILCNEEFRSQKTTIDFTLTFKIYHGSEIIYKQLQKDMCFINATPTSPELFDYDINLSAGVKRLKGFKDGEWVQEQLSYCDTLLIPLDVTEIDYEAFVDEKYIQKHTSIPENITRLILDKTHGHGTSSLHTIQGLAFADATQLTGELYIPSSVQTIGELAFDNAAYDQIVFGGPTKAIGTWAFANTPKCSEVDLSIYSYVPGTDSFDPWGGIEIFSGMLADSKNILYVASEELGEKWLTYLDSITCVEMLSWTVKVKE